MNSINSAFIGVDIGFSKIQYYLFNSKGSCLSNYLVATKPLSPGCFTISITETMDFLDKDNKISSIIIAVPGSIDQESKYVASLKGWPGWCDVPLVDWLEVRLNRNILLFRKESFYLINDSTIFNYKIKKQSQKF